MTHLEKRAQRSIVVTPHVEAAAAAERILRSGGNVVDASVAAMMALCVAMPGAVGLGGYGGSMIVWLGRQRRAEAVDFTAPAPLRFDAALYAEDPQRARSGPLSITVPAVLAGLDLALRRFGTCNWDDICRHPAQMAEQGVMIDAELHRHLLRWRSAADPASVEALLGRDDVPQVGQALVQKDLARLIRRIGREGPAALYEGEVPQQICRQIRDRGGILCEEDFRRCQPRIVEPLAAPYSGHELLTPPPPSGGITTCAILQTLEQFDPSGMSPRGGMYLHILAEAAKICWRQRNALLGDPDSVSIPMDRLLGETAARQRASQIRIAGPASAAPLSDSPQHTCNVVAADEEGNVVSLTATQGLQFGSQMVIQGLGLVMNHGMSRFTLDPHSPNFPAPGRRMQHNMAPMLIMRDGRPRFAVGLPGGPRIVTVTAQLAAALISFGSSPAEAAAAPRLHVEADEPLLLTRDFPPASVEALRAMGHQVEQADEVGGPANILRIDPATLLGATGAGAAAIAAL